MIRDFFSGVVVLVLAAVVAGGVHHRGLRRATLSSEHASVKPQKVHPILQMIRSLKDKKPVQAGINCFGTTVAAFGDGPVPRYASDKEIEIFLRKSCEELGSKELVKNFDVGVIYGAETMDPAHSFMILGRGIVFYKNGIEAKTAFVVEQVAPMLKDFRVGFSRSACDDIMAKAEVETGLPCPGIVKRYRCKSDQMPKWPALDRVEALVYPHVMRSTSIAAKDKMQISQSIAALTGAQSIATVSGTKALDRTAVLERLESLDTFFGFYADRKIWGEDSVRSMRILIKSAITTLRNE